MQRRATKLAQLPNPRAQNESRGSRRHAHAADQLFVPRYPSRPVHVCPRHR